MKKLLLTLTVLVGGFFMPGQAQTVDVETGVEGYLTGVKTPYADVRFNFRVGPQVFSQDAYAVFETGAMFVSQPVLWLAGEFILDGEYSTEFARFEYTETSGLYFKTGVRFGFGQ